MQADSRSDSPDLNLLRVKLLMPESSALKADGGKQKRKLQQIEELL